MTTRRVIPREAGRRFVAVPPSCRAARLAAALLAGWSSVAVAAFSQSQPEPPGIPPDVVSISRGRQVRGHLSPRRSTHDGRVRVAGSAAGAKRWFYTARPELFARDLAEEGRTSDGDRLAVDPSLFHASTAAGALPGHVEICDPYLARGRRANPYVCGGAGRTADCYDVEILLAVNVPEAGGAPPRAEIWSTPVTIVVRRPKTPAANVARVELRGLPVRSPIERLPPRSGDVLLEPVTTGDGRLLIVNAGDTLLYAVMDARDAPCDARGWKRLLHLSKASRDPRMARYGIGRYPIRDTENRTIKPGRPLRGAYPWIDREGKNLFFTQVGGDGLFYRDAGGKTRSRFEVSNRPRRRELEFGGATRFGMSYFGLWSQGKIVVPDTRVNNVDFHTGKRGYRARLRLYQGDPGEVEVERSPIVDLNSPESQWSYRPPLLPRAPRDVVWWLSASNGMTGEVVFDDSLDAGTLIYSPMNAAVDNKKLVWRDGFDSRRGGYVKGPRIQNAAATRVLWDLPPSGRLIGARVEPIAAGGVVGKGLWLDGDSSRLEYRVPSQARGSDMAEAVWTTALWLDPRSVERRRRLLTFPDGSWVELEASRLVLGGSGAEAAIGLPPALAPRPGQWSHLAFVTSASHADVYVQGFQLASVPGSFLRPRAGTLTIGRPRSAAVAGIHGWIDELRVTSGSRGPEQICNYAHGTLRGVDRGERPTDFDAAASYPAAFHDEISARLAASARRTWERYVCERERDADHPCLADIQRFRAREPSCVGPALRLPEGPLFHDLPRPDSRANPACRGCHLAAHPTESLRVAAPLRAGPPATTLPEDPRRQPRQAPLRLHGLVPKELLGLPEDLAAPPEGLLLDPWLYPAALGDAAGGRR